MAQRGRPKKNTAPEDAPVIGSVKEDPEVDAITEHKPDLESETDESLEIIKAELEAAKERIAELEQEEEKIIIMDRQAPFTVINGKALTINKKRQAVPKGARYYQYGAYFNCGGIILEGQKVTLPDRPRNIRVIGRM